MDIDTFKFILVDRIKPDLNLIYTERPFNTTVGFDFGWFCREHALHVWLVSLLMGFESTIIIGDVHIQTEEGPISTLAGDGDHAWCSIGDVAPVDASLSLRFIPNRPDVRMIFGSDSKLSAPFVVHYSREPQSGTFSQESRGTPSIWYFEEARLSWRPEELLANPFDFLIQPEAGPSLVQTRGDDIFDRITQHCLKLATGEAKPLSRYLGPKEALKRIVEWNPTARDRIRTSLNAAKY